MPGILPYVNFNPETGARDGDVYVMISQERKKDKQGDRPFDFFNGRIDKGETPRQAAVREGYEESCGLFGSMDELDKKMIKLKKSSGGFLINAEDFKSKKEIMEKCTNDEYMKRRKFSKYKAACFQEKSEVKWVKLSSLIDACATDAILKGNNGMPIKALDGKNIKIRAPLVHLINKNKAQFSDLLKQQKKLIAKIELEKNQLDQEEKKAGDKINQLQKMLAMLQQQLAAIQAQKAALARQ